MGARWLKPVLLASSLTELSPAIAATIGLLGFRYFIYRGRFPQRRSGAQEVRFDNCPEAWHARYGEDGWDGVSNPVRLRALQEIAPILWRQVRHCDLFAEARKLGCVTGVTHPVHGPGGQWSAISFIKDYGGPQAEREIEIALTKCHLLTTYVHDSVARIVKRGFHADLERQPGSQSLNERECAILAFIAQGKTVAEIADLLPISERTVNFHLYNARRKLGAANSRHAITKALALGLIEPGGDSSGEKNFRARAR